MALFGEIHLTNDAAALVAGVIGTLWTALVMMWRSDVARRAEEVADLRKQRDELLDVVIRNGLRDEIPAAVPPGEIPRRRGGQ